ncbi:DUF5996 family protein [Peredibacter starrii]|uniref:DUF5996 family protein n=1 Tax=Peredibacter starrii TaxID=28202 RepID=A0AAX4HR54_9BACT|nr:DUF5996 family protein [Peredibacter starrii]WPU65726.1 DUF5996 family protein [Peredibacter starrii]
MMNLTWPTLEYSEWKDTYETLHRWTQIVGKLRLCKSPWCNHSWNTTLYVTSRGLSTSAIPLGQRNLTVDFDFHDHQLIFQDSVGKSFVLLLQNETVASFYERFLEALKIMDVEPNFDPVPNEVSDGIPFAEDTVHRTYDPLKAHNFFQALVRVNNIFQEFRTDFVGKSSPVHFFWGSFDLAITRFSGRRAPEHPGGIPNLPNDVVREAYSHEEMSCGFWPGNEMYPHAAFYSYAYPEPDHFSKAKVMPPEAIYNQDLHEFILPYETVRTSLEPAATLMSFLESSYRAAANLGHWDRDMLEVSPYLYRLKERVQFSFDDIRTEQ